MSGEAKQHFQKVVDTGAPVGEIIAVDRFLITVRGMQPVTVHSPVIFEDSSKGFVHHILPSIRRLFLRTALRVLYITFWKIKW